MKNIKYPLFVFCLLFSFSLIQPSNTFAADKCSFTRDLELGVIGEDVRCLQQYLNTSGYIISDTGVGSPGKETNQFKSLTSQAVIRWQKQNNLPGTGFFGILSRQKYDSIVNGNTVVSSGNLYSNEAVEVLKEKIISLTSELNTLKSFTIKSSEEENSSDQIVKALDMIEDAESEIDDYSGDKQKAENNLLDAKDDIMDAILFHFKGNYIKSLKYSDNAYDGASDAFKDAGGKTREDEIEDLISEVEDDFDNAENQIADADDNGRDTKHSEDLLNEAEEYIDRANDALDDENIDDAEDLIEEARDLIDDAIDNIGKGDEDAQDAQDNIDDAEDAINNARTTINSAQDDIDDAEDDDEDTDEANDLLDESKDLLNEARDLLNEAEEEFDDENYKDAEDLAKEAEDLAEEAESLADDAVDAL